MSRGYARIAAVADPAVPHAGDRRTGLRRQPAAGQRLAGPGRRRPGRHDDHPARPLAQHAASGGRARRSRSSKPASQQLVQTLDTLGSTRWVLIDSARSRAARARVARRDSRIRRAPGRPAPRPICRRCCRRRTTTSRTIAPAGPKSGSAPTCARTTGTPKAAAGRALRDSFPGVPAERAVSSAGLSDAGAGQRRGPRDRRRAPDDERRRRSCWCRCG